MYILYLYTVPDLKESRFLEVQADSNNQRGLWTFIDQRSSLDGHILESSGPDQLVLSPQSFVS